MDPGILTVVEASKICGVTRATVWRWIKSGQLRAGTTAGGHHRIDREILHQFMTQKHMYSKNRGCQPPRILVVDDDPYVGKLCARLLEKEVKGLLLAFASDGFDAGIKVAKFKPDLIILDLFIPKLDGFDVCRQIRRTPDTRHIKILAISGQNTAKERDIILAQGADEFHPKPINPEIFTKRVKHLLGNITHG